MKSIVSRAIVSIVLCIAAILIFETAAINYYVAPRAEAEFIAKFNIDEIEEEVRKPFVAEFHLFSESDLQPDCLSCLTKIALSRVKIAFIVLEPSPGVREIYWIVPSCDGIANCIYNEKYDLNLVPETQEALSTLAAGFSTDSQCEYSYILIYEVQSCTTSRLFRGVAERVSYNLSVDIPHLFLLFYPRGPGTVTTVYRTSLNFISGSCLITKRGNVVSNELGGCT